MPYPPNMTQVTLTFGLHQAGAETDIAEFSLWAVADPFPTGAADLQAYLDQRAQDVYEAWADAMDPVHWHTNVSLDSVTARVPNADGSTRARGGYVPTSLWAGSSASACLPWQTSIVLSLYCYTPGGFVSQAKSKRGRIYLPPPAVSSVQAGGTGNIEDATISQLLSELKEFLGVLSGTHNYSSGGVTISFDSDLVVVSREHAYATPVIYLRMDNRFDTQRRRANRATVLYQGESYP